MPAAAPSRRRASPAWRSANARLHALAAELNLTHDDLRDLRGVASLRDLTALQMQRYADDLQARLDRQRVERLAVKPGAPRLATGPSASATKAQRDGIDARFRQLGWPRSKRAAWLLKRHAISGLWHPALTRGQATDVITQLDLILAKEAT